MKVEAYLNFEGRCAEALEFYRQAVGAEIDCVMKFKDSPEPCDPAMVPPGSEDKVMHSSFRIGDTTIMASDCGCSGKPSFGGGISLALSAADPDHAKRVFDALANGGQVHMPLAPTFFSASFGVLADRFGVNWMVVAPQA